MYTRAAASDYDDWESVYENPGWGSKYLIPLIKKAETFQSDINPSTHGKSGPIKVSFAEEETDVASDFLAAASQYDKGRKFADDVNGFFKCDVYGKWPRYVDAASGRRSDTPHNYIYGRTENTQLRILERRRVVRVIFESGIGGAEVLERNKVTQIVDLPGVGENYMDHNTKFVPYFASDDADTLDTIFRGVEDEVKPLSVISGLDAGIRLRPTEKDLKDLGPDFEETWKNYFENAPDKPIMFLGTLAAFVGAPPAAPRRKYFSCAVFTGYPVSRGRVHIGSGLDPYGKLDFETGFLNHPADLCVLRWVYKKGRELARRMRCYRGEYAPAHPEFPKDSKAAADIATGPVDVAAPDIEYSAEDDKAIDDYYRKNGLWIFTSPWSITLLTVCG
ncbi:hypothetical protein H0H92_000913 [Tricholoma furcatifolium]|nr:hypothetical protein H0H92_000913 [Tricholoma furcatifolium]